MGVKNMSMADMGEMPVVTPPRATAFSVHLGEFECSCCFRTDIRGVRVSSAKSHPHYVLLCSACAIKIGQVAGVQSCLK